MFVDIFDHHILPIAWKKKKKDGGESMLIGKKNDAEIKCKYI